MKNITKNSINLLLLFFLVFSLNSCLNSCESAKEKKARENLKSMDDYIKKTGERVEIKEVVCSTCRGTGKLKCKDCKGTGKYDGGAWGVAVTDGNTGKTTYPGDDCPKCNGFGYFVCEKCGGSGKVKELK